MQKPSLRIRRATILDTVALFRLLVDFERARGTAVPQDEAARMAHILQTITTGFVLVVERAGRVCGSIGFGAGGPAYTLQNSLVSQWQVLPNGLAANYRVLETLVRDLAAFADEFKVEVLFADGGEPNDRLDRVLEDNGFKVRSVLYSRAPAIEQPEPITASPEPADPDVDDWESGTADADTDDLLGPPTAGAVPADAFAEPALHAGEGTPGEAADL